MLIVSFYKNLTSVRIRLFVVFIHVLQALKTVSDIY